MLGEESESQLSPEPPGSDEVRLSQPRAGRRAWADTRTGGIRDMVTTMVIIMVMVTIMIIIMVIIMVITINLTQETDLLGCFESATQVHRTLRSPVREVR